MGPVWIDDALCTEEVVPQVVAARRTGGVLWAEGWLVGEMVTRSFEAQIGTYVVLGSRKGQPHRTAVPGSHENWDMDVFKLAQSAKAMGAGDILSLNYTDGLGTNGSFDLELVAQVMVAVRRAAGFDDNRRLLWRTRQQPVEQGPARWRSAMAGYE